MFDFKITPQLWFAEKAEEAARFYVSVFPNSRIDSVYALPAESPSGPADSVPIVEFTLAGQPFLAFSAHQVDSFNLAISLIVKCADQAEIDRLWDGLGQGGEHQMCGWLKDRYGVAWQIMPAQMMTLMKDKDRARAGRVANAMLKMRKLDAAVLKRAYDG